MAPRLSAETWSTRRYRQLELRGPRQTKPSHASRSPQEPHRAALVQMLLGQAERNQEMLSN